MKKLITDKTLIAFEKWFYENHGKCSKKYEELLHWQKSEIMDWIFNACDTIQHAFLIEFFDSVGVYIEIGGYKPHLVKKPADYWYNIHQENTNPKPNNQSFTSRQEATEQAIIKANEIFNNR